MPTTITERAQRLHRAFEQRMKLKHIPSYPGREWDELTVTEQAEFLEIATIIHHNRDMRESDLAVILCEHYGMPAGRDNVVYFVRRIREANGPTND